jgi:hypothetical protein
MGRPARETRGRRVHGERAENDGNHSRILRMTARRALAAPVWPTDEKWSVLLTYCAVYIYQLISRILTRLLALVIDEC